MALRECARLCLAKHKGEGDLYRYTRSHRVSLPFCQRSRRKLCWRWLTFVDKIHGVKCASEVFESAVVATADARIEKDGYRSRVGRVPERSE